MAPVSPGNPPQDAPPPTEPPIDTRVPGQVELHPDHARVRRLAWLLDQSIPVPVLGRRIGLDGLIGLVPGIGDLAGGAISAYLIWLAHRLGAPLWLKLRMVGFVAVETVLGAIPLLGDLFDFGFKANTRIARLLDEHLSRQASDQRRT